MTAGHQFDALDKDMLVEIAIGQRAEIERLRKENHTLRQAFADKTRRALEPKP